MQQSEGKEGTVGAFSLFINEAELEEVKIQRKAEKRIVHSVVHGTWLIQGRRENVGVLMKLADLKHT